MLSEVEFAAYLAYTPRGDSETAKQSRVLRDRVKGDRIVPSASVPMSTVIARRIKQALATLPFSDWFGQQVTLVPVPSTSLMRPNTLWVPKNLALALEKEGLGKAAELLHRTQPLPKAAFAPTIQARPTAQDHLRTLSVDQPVQPPAEILLVDDIITTGSTLVGAAGRLKDVFPQARVRGFAAIRTISNPAEFCGLVAPCTGKVVFQPSGRTTRRP